MPRHSARSFTVYAVDKGTRKFTSDDGYPWAHCSSEEQAQTALRALERGKIAKPTRIEDREGNVLWSCEK